MAVSLILSVWAIIDIFKSGLSRMNKFLWLMVVLFAPFGMLIYFIFGRRMKPVLQTPAAEMPENDFPEKNESVAPVNDEKKRKFLLGPIIILTGLCIVTYVNVVGTFGREKTGVILLVAMAFVALGVVLSYVIKAKKKQ